MELTQRFSEALAYAAKLHAAQKRKLSGAPYVSHLLRVAGIVLEHGADEDEAIAALLHDAVEDQGGAKTLEEIRRRFGPRVAEIVAACSDTDQTPKPPGASAKRRISPTSAGLPLRCGWSPPPTSWTTSARSSPAITHAAESLWEQFQGGPRRHALVLLQRRRDPEGRPAEPSGRRTRPRRRPTGATGPPPATQTPLEIGPALLLSWGRS